jgi:hypothetical protein
LLSKHSEALETSDPRCSQGVRKHQASSRRRTAADAASALAVFLLAVTLPHAYTPYADTAGIRRMPAAALLLSVTLAAHVPASSCATVMSVDKDKDTVQDTLIAPIRNKLLQLETEGARSEADLRDAITANTLAGNIGAALAAMRLLLARYPLAVRGEDLYKAALLAKSMGEEEEATARLMEYLQFVGWTSVSSLSFLGTLLFEQGRFAEAEGAFKLSIRLGARNPPIHTMSMLVSTALRRGNRAHAQAVYAALLGHSVTVRRAATVGTVGDARAIPLDFGVLQINVAGQRGTGLVGESGGDGYVGGGGGYVRGGDGFVDEQLLAHLAHSRGQGGLGGGREVERVLVEAEIRAQQFPSVCAGRPLVLHDLGDRKSGWGMGSMMHELVLNFLF